MKEALIARLREEATYDLNHQTIALLLEAAQALAAPVQEPVAWLYKDEWGKTKFAFSKETANEWGTEVRPLVFGDTTPPAAQRPWVGLPDEEKQEWVEAMPDEPKPRHIMNLINVIEAKLKEKNT